MTGASASITLRGGVIAAGHGTRLRADGYRVSKPMTPVGGRPLIEHALDRFRAVGVRQVTVIVNEESDDCRRWLAGYSADLDLDVIVRTTPSSYASFELVATGLAGAPALITTVDAIMPVDAFEQFVDSAARFPNDAVVLGLTDYVDDDNPLWAARDEDGRILRLGGDQASHVTAGLYRPRRGASAACATISNGWSTRAGRFMASYCLSCSISTGRATSMPPSGPDFAAPLRALAHEHGPRLHWRVARARALARPRRG
jgi:choline kinase